MPPPTLLPPALLDAADRLITPLVSLVDAVTDSATLPDTSSTPSSSASPTSS